MRFLSNLICFTAAAVIGLSGCGGGGGSAGTPAGGNKSAPGNTGVGAVVVSPPVVPTPTITLSLQNSAGVTTRSINAVGFVTALATVRGVDGLVVSGAKVTFDADVALLKISPANSVLTDSTGTARVQVSAAALSAAGAGTLGAAASVGSYSLVTSFDFQLSPANVTLSSIVFGVGTLPAYGNQSVSVQANINGAAATTIPVKVTFSTSCGTVSPVSVPTDSTGRASVTYTADSAFCAGRNVIVTATGVGVTSSISDSFSVDPVKATNLQFIGATPAVIYLAGSGSITQSQVVFKVVDSLGNAVQNQKVNLALGNASAGTNISLDLIGNSANVSKTTDAMGLVAVAVFSGDVPTSATVSASLEVPFASVKSTSNTLTIASGVPVQKASSLATDSLSVEGFEIDGITSSVTFSVADRQGNPVPDGTSVNFVSESGVMLPARCVITGGSSKCVSQFRTGGTRPSNGLVSILAYTSGEEDFKDLNSNNKYDLGEPFTDLGNAFRDDDGSLSFTTGEFSVPRAGNVACEKIIEGADSPVNSKAGSCDGVWGPNEVRREAVIVLATSSASISILSSSNSLIVARVSDLNGNSMALGTAVTAVKFSGSDECAVKFVSPGLIPNRLSATLVSIDLDKCSAGSPSVPATSTAAAIPAVPSDVIRIVITSPNKIESSVAVTISQ